jgi:peptidoglycan-N-acetylglucosamine deacetylase
VQPQCLSFTFDDGPDETWTPLVLEQLARCEVTATFFMIGERVRLRPEVANLVLAAGQDVQLHCDRHVRHTELTEAELLLDTETALDALWQIGVRPRLWRAPWGICNDTSVRVAARGDLPLRMLARVRERLHDGGAVLMHDAIGPGARRAGCQNTVALLPALAAVARDRGLALAPMRVMSRRAGEVAA